MLILQSLRTTNAYANFFSPDAKLPQIVNVVPVQNEVDLSFHLVTFLDRIYDYKIT